MRTELVALALLLALAPCRGSEPPVTGKAVPDYEPVDEVVLAFFKRFNATAAAVAVSVDGKSAYSRGYCWLDGAKGKSTPPDALFRIASISKTMTNAILKELFAAGKLRPGDKVLPLLGGSPADERWGLITVQHLMDHTGGWDGAQTGDPMFRRAEVRKALKLSGQPTPAIVVKYMLTQPLQSDPGKRRAYSNFGYCVLGRVIEKATGGTFAEALDRYVAGPAKTKDIRLARDKRSDRDKREVGYPVPDGALSVELIDAAGGVVASAPALCQYLLRYWASGDRWEPGQHGEYAVFGSLPGTTAMVRQRNGIDVAVLYNGRRDDSIEADNSDLQKAIDAAIDKAVKGPKK